MIETFKQIRLPLVTLAALISTLLHAEPVFEAIANLIYLGCIVYYLYRLIAFAQLVRSQKSESDVQIRCSVVVRKMKRREPWQLMHIRVCKLVLVINSILLASLAQHGAWEISAIFTVTILMDELFRRRLMEVVECDDQRLPY